MKNGDYFKGKFMGFEYSTNHKLIQIKLKDKGWDNFRFYDRCWYYLKNGELYYSYNKPISGNEITHQEFEDWILNKQPLNPQYEVY